LGTALKYKCTLLYQIYVACSWPQIIEKRREEKTKNKNGKGMEKNGREKKRGEKRKSFVFVSQMEILALNSIPDTCSCD
jgi:hypothetical protein